MLHDPLVVEQQAKAIANKILALKTKIKLVGTGFGGICVYKAYCMLPLQHRSLVYQVEIFDPCINMLENLDKAHVDKVQIFRDESSFMSYMLLYQDEYRVTPIRFDRNDLNIAKQQMMGLLCATVHFSYILKQRIDIHRFAILYQKISPLLALISTDFDDLCNDIANMVRAHVENTENAKKIQNTFIQPILDNKVDKLTDNALYYKHLRQNRNKFNDVNSALLCDVISITDYAKKMNSLLKNARGEIQHIKTEKQKEISNLKAKILQMSDSIGSLHELDIGAGASTVIPTCYIMSHVNLLVAWYHFYYFKGYTPDAIIEADKMNHVRNFVDELGETAARELLYKKEINYIESKQI
jgi:hypothetical protein